MNRQGLWGWYLCHVGHEVVGDPLRIFSDHPRLVGADGVEVAQEDGVPVLGTHGQGCPVTAVGTELGSSPVGRLLTLSALQRSRIISSMKNLDLP